MARVEVITGTERRRRWSEEQNRGDHRREFGAGSERQRGCSSRRVCPGQIYRWRQEYRPAVDGFAQVLLALPEPLAGEANCVVGGEPAIEGEFTSRVRVRKNPMWGSA